MAADLGASNGRVIAGSFDGINLELKEVNRFGNVPVVLNGHYHWNVLALLSGVREGLAKARSDGLNPVSVGVDTWGVDYAMLDADGRLLGIPYMYRDSRTDGMLKLFCDNYGRRKLYDRTGIQFMEINTVFQLLAEAGNKDSLLDRAKRLLMMPDLINYWLSGVAANESTIASTGQLVALDTRDWAWDIVKAVGAPEHLFQPLTRPGTVLGEVYDMPGLKSVVVGGHDTACAVASVPARNGTDWGYLSTGTWALMGVELDQPVLSDASYEAQFTHEGGVSGNLRFLKNITGFWITQELRRAWKEEGEDIAFDTLTSWAEKAEPFVSLVNPDDPSFATPGDMPAKVAEYCKRTGQPVPQDKGAFVRAALEGMVFRYRETWRDIEALTGVKRNVLHMLGGGTVNRLHCQMTADALGVNLVCGPLEGAATGNILVQMLAAGEIGSLEEGRELVRSSSDLSYYEPRNPASWDEMEERWKKIRTLS